MVRHNRKKPKFSKNKVTVWIFHEYGDPVAIALGSGTALVPKQSVAYKMGLHIEQPACIQSFASVYSYTKPYDLRLLSRNVLPYRQTKVRL